MVSRTIFFLQVTGWTFTYLHVEKIGENAKFRSRVYKNLDIFETVHFMIRICVDEAHYEEWFKKMRFQWADSLIFCGRKANICVILLKGAR